MNRPLARTPKRPTARTAVQAIAITSMIALAGCGSDTTTSADPATTLGAETTTPETTTPSTDTSPETTAAPPSTEPVEESTTTAAPTTLMPTTAAPTTAAPTTEAPVPTEPSAALTTAGSFGVTVGVPLGSESLIVTEPMELAVTADDGRIFMQRATADNNPDLDPTPLVSIGGTTELTPVELPGAAEGSPQDTVKIHDVATIDGQVTLLYETVPADCSNAEACIGAIMTFQPDTGVSTEVDSKIVFEGGWGGLELARNGLIVGTTFESISVGIYLASIGDAPIPTAADLGIEESYGDCNVCPFAYAIDPTGRYIGWVDRGEGVVQDTPDANDLGNQIVVVDISEEGAFSRRRIGLDASGAFGVLDIADIAFGDEGFVNGQAMFQNSGTDADNNPLEPVKVDLRDGQVGGIAAIWASLNPNPAEN